jgi:hypothetical protein
MRRAIRNRLLATIADVGKRIYEPFVPGPATVKPYIVVKKGGDIATNMRYGFEVPFEIWLYCDRTSFVELDSLQSKVVIALDEVELETAGGQKFELKFIGASEDYYDDDWQALTRRLDFRTVRVWGG